MIKLKEPVDDSQDQRPVFFIMQISMTGPMVTINLKPWKGKVSSIRFVASLDEPVSDQVKKVTLKLKDKGEHKRRTIESYTVDFKMKL